jgi:hypothetical protein
VPLGLSNGVTRSIAGAGTDADTGLVYVDISYVGTFTGAENASVVGGTSATTTAASVGQAWSASMNWAVVSGSLPAPATAGINGVRIRYGSPGLLVQTGSSDTPNTVFATRQVNQNRIAPASTTVVGSDWLWSFSAGQAIDCTVRFGAFQLETGSTATAYIPTTTAAVTVVLPRITNRGILVEEARTNKGTSHNANPTEAAGFVGNPVNMSKSGDAAGILSVVDDAAALAAAGLSGACTSGKAYKLDNTAGAANAIASINGTVGNLNAHAFSCYARATAGSGSVGRSGSSVGAATFSSSAYARASAVLTPTATTEVLRVQALPGAVVYFILAQLEEGAFATSPIITTGAAGTRGADTPAVAFANALGNGRTLFAEFTGTVVSGGAGNIGIVSLDDGTSNNRTQMRATYSAGTAQQLVVNAGSVLENTSVGFARTLTTFTKQALRISSDGKLRTANDGTVLASDSAAFSIPTTNSLTFGTTPGSVAVNGYIRRVQVLPYAATDAQLQALTAP